MSIFDDIPSNIGGARRENPKLYNMRKRRALVQLGLMEWEMAEVPETPRGVQIMALLDVLEEKMEWERREKAMGARARARAREQEGKGKGKARTIKFVGEAGAEAYCANDARSGFGLGYVRPGREMKAGRGMKSSSKGKRVGANGKASNKGKTVDRKGKCKAV
jgi:hypothetical protein